MSGPDTQRFLGAGLPFPEVVPRHGDPVAGHEQSIRQSIEIILGTSPGERLMRPDFGVGLQDLVFTLGGATTAGAAADAVRRGLVRWEPRIDVIDVVAQFDPAPPRTLAIRIAYRVRSTNNVFNLVYPFFLDPGASG